MLQYKILLYVCAVRLLVWIIKKINIYIVMCGTELWHPLFISFQMYSLVCLCCACDFV